MENENNHAKRFERKPNLDFRTKLSRDGRYWILERVETWILPAKYLSVIAQNRALESDQSSNGDGAEKPKRKGKRNADGNGQGN